MVNGRLAIIATIPIKKGLFFSIIVVEQCVLAFFPTALIFPIPSIISSIRWHWCFFSLMFYIVLFVSCVMDRKRKETSSSSSVEGKKKKQTFSIYIHLEQKLFSATCRFGCSIQFHRISEMCIKNGSKKNDSNKSQHFSLPSHKKYTKENNDCCWVRDGVLLCVHRQQQTRTADASKITQNSR